MALLPCFKTIFKQVYKILKHLNKDFLRKMKTKMQYPLKMFILRKMKIKLSFEETKIFCIIYTRILNLIQYKNQLAYK